MWCWLAMVVSGGRQQRSSTIRNTNEIMYTQRYIELPFLKFEAINMSETQVLFRHTLRVDNST